MNKYVIRDKKTNMFISPSGGGHCVEFPWRALQFNSYAEAKSYISDKEEVVTIDNHGNIF